MNSPQATHFTIRTLAPGDRSWLVDFIVKHWGAREVVVHNSVYYPENLPGFAAERDGIIAGVVTCHIDEKGCEIVTINCELPHEGAGTLLLNEVEAFARQKGCHRCWLITTNDNLDGMRFYQRRGYRMSAVHYGGVTAAREVKPAIPLVGDYGITLQDEVVFEKTL